MANGVETLSTTSFDELIASSELPVLVDFWAEWCGPCKAIAPILEEIATEEGDRVRVAKLNVDDNPDIARRFDVMSIPTLILFKEGSPEARLVGAKGKGPRAEDTPPPLEAAAPRGRAATTTPPSRAGRFSGPPSC